MGQCVTESVFRKHLGRFGVEVELGTELTALEQDSEGVTATLRITRTGGEEAVEILRAAYVIGADGGRGQCRSLCSLRRCFDERTRKNTEVNRCVTRRPDKRLGRSSLRGRRVRAFINRRASVRRHALSGFLNH